MSTALHERPPPGPPAATGERERALRPPITSRGALPAVVLVGLLAAGLWAVWDLRINVATFVDGFANAAAFAQRVLPLDLPPLGEVLRLCAQTLAIAGLATVLSALISVPLAALAASTTSPSRSTRLASRTITVIARAIPDVVIAIVLVRVFGIGALTGVLAMGLHSVGMVAKMYADAIEQADPGPAEALTAAGATRLQRFAGGVVPQVLPAWVAVGLHRLDINLRVSVLLGFVGVGGIGYAIAESLRVLDYQRGLALALVVLVLCVLIELLSGAIRSALLRPGSQTEGARRWGLPFVRRPAAPSPPSATSTTARPLRAPTSPAALTAAGRISPPWDARRVRTTGYGVLAAGALVAAVVVAGIDPLRALADLPSVITTLGRFLPPETGGALPTLLEALWVTVKIAMAATVIGVVLSLPIGALAAHNTSPSPAVAQAARLVILVIRGIPELILAIVLVVITGLGEVAGAVALGIGGVGLLGKLVADSLEEVDPGPETALRAAGATRLQVTLGATLPAGVKALVAHCLYLLDTNIRAATLLGIVGAGGIGFYLLNASRVLDFGVVTTVLLLIFAAVMLVELLALWLRSRS